MKNSARLLTPALRRAVDTIRDLAPIVIVIAFFQLVALQQPFPNLGNVNLGNVIVGLVCVSVGLGLFVQGLESGLFPLGEVLARGFANKGSRSAVLAFAFCLGFGATIAEPALIAVADEAAEVASETGAIADSDRARSSYALELRLVVAVSVGLAILLEVIRILKGWPIHHLIIGGYVRMRRRGQSKLGHDVPYVQNVSYALHTHRVLGYCDYLREGISGDMGGSKGGAGDRKEPSCVRPAVHLRRSCVQIFAAR